MKVTWGLLLATLLLTSCGEESSSETGGEPPDPEPETEETTTTAEPSESDGARSSGDAAYRKVSRQMNKYYPGEGWGDLSTTRQAVENVCEAIEDGYTSTEVARFYSEDGDPIQANALVAFATDYVCPEDG